jgi:hypothetical protein
MKRINFSNRDLERRFMPLATRFNYTAVENADGVWLENRIDEPPFEHCRVTAATVPSARSLLERYVAEYSSSPEYVVHYSKCLELLSGLAKDVSLDQIEFFKRGIMFCPRIKLRELFENAIAPIFFGVFSDGEIIIVRTRVAYWRLNGFKRVLYTAALYPDQVANGEISTFGSLQKWNRLEPDNFLSVVLRIAQYLFFPYVAGFTASHGIGLKIVFIPSHPFEYTRPPFPSDWMDFLRADTELAEEHTVHSQPSKDLFEKPSRSIYGKYAFTNSPSRTNTIELLEWAIGAANQIVSRQYDVTNFSSKDVPEEVDPVYGQEYTHSLMHVLRDGASIIAQDSRYRNKATTFRIADILAALAEQGSLQKRQDEFFRELFSWSAGRSNTRAILYETEVGALKTFADTSDLVYQAIKTTILDSIFIANKRQGQEVIIKSPSLNSEHLIGEDEFCVQTIRALRNTQHGYLTRGDRYSNRPARFLSMIDGNTPDDLPTLGLTWVLALLASPSKFIGDPS